MPFTDWLWSDDGLAHLPSSLRCGWLDGGCLILADALQMWSGYAASLMGLRFVDDDSVLGHLMVEARGRLIDANGCQTPAELERYWREEGLRRVLDLVPFGSLRLHPEIPRDLEASVALAQALQARFGPWTFGSSSSGGAGSPFRRKRGVGTARVDKLLAAPRLSLLDPTSHRPRPFHPLDPQAEVEVRPLREKIQQRFLESLNLARATAEFEGFPSSLSLLRAKLLEEEARAARYWAAPVVSQRHHAQALPLALHTLIENQVAAANGLRRMRIVSTKTVEAMVLDAVALEKSDDDTTSVDYRHGGHVANSYGYAAYATGVLVLRRADVVGLCVSVVNASRGSTGFGQISRWERQEIPVEPRWIWIRVTR